MNGDTPVVFTLEKKQVPQRTPYRIAQSVPRSLKLSATDLNYRLVSKSSLVEFEPSVEQDSFSRLQLVNKLLDSRQPDEGLSQGRRGHSLGIYQDRDYFGGRSLRNLVPYLRLPQEAR